MRLTQGFTTDFPLNMSMCFSVRPVPRSVSLIVRSGGTRGSEPVNFHSRQFVLKLEPISTPNYCNTQQHLPCIFDTQLQYSSKGRVKKQIRRLTCYKFYFFRGVCETDLTYS